MAVSGDSLQDIIHALTRATLQVELKAGYQDSINGYGWHTVFFVTVYETVEYCPKCVTAKGVNYSDDAHPFNNHKHESKLNVIHAERYRDVGDLINGLNETLTKFTNQNQIQK